MEESRRIRLEEQLQQERDRFRATLENVEPQDDDPRHRRLAELEKILEQGLAAVDHFDLPKLENWLEGGGLSGKSPLPGSEHDDES